MPRRDGSGTGTAAISLLRIGVLRVVEHRRARADLDDLAEIHHRDAVADALDHRHVVRDEQEGEAEALLQVEQQIADLRLDRDVERRDAFVGDDHLRIERQRAGDADALALAAGEFMRIARHHVGLQADAFAADRPPRSRACAASPRPCSMIGSAMAAPTRHARIEAGERILEDHLDAAAHRRADSAASRLSTS